MPIWLQGMHIIEEGSTMVVTSSWATIPEWEEWSLSPAARRTHMPMVRWGAREGSYCCTGS